MNPQAPVATRARWHGNRPRGATLCGRPRICILAGSLAALGAVLSLHHPGFLVQTVAAGLWLGGTELFGRPARA